MPGKINQPVGRLRITIHLDPRPPKTSNKGRPRKSIAELREAAALRKRQSRERLRQSRQQTDNTSPQHLDSGTDSFFDMAAACIFCKIIRGRWSINRCNFCTFTHGYICRGNPLNEAFRVGKDVCIP